VDDVAGFDPEANGYLRCVNDQLPDVHFEFDNEPGAPRKARQALSPMFADPNDSIADSVTLTASELVTNVVLHTDSGGIMQAWDPKPDIPLRLEVEDHDPTIPTTRDNLITGGHGLMIVDNVADAWGVEPTTDGKVVWAEFNRPADA
jgi:anti-sigma regulatory factor (Ser/Thr protein kinase)